MRSLRPLTAFSALAAAAVAEMWLLHLITHHPAGGWGEDPDGALRNLVLWAALPVLACTIAIISCFRHPLIPVKRLGAVRHVALAGPAALVLALLMYGHTIFVFLLAGFLYQSFYAALSFAPPDRAS